MSAQIQSLRKADIAELVRLARAIWYAHYPNIIPAEQIEYMLAQRYHADVIGAQLESKGYWWHKLVLDDAMVAFSACELPGNELKLDKLYVHQDLQRRGYGSQLLQFTENLARSQGCQAVYLQVNKNNTSAIHAYKRNGYAVRDSVIFDIGNGFVMDDYVMAKKIARGEE
ncbi:MAG: GNAT family N-acetyltransferase [Burkholderiales bacterium]